MQKCLKIIQNGKLLEKETDRGKIIIFKEKRRNTTRDRVQKIKNIKNTKNIEKDLIVMRTI